MKRVFTFFAMLLIVFGAIWVLQGMNFLPGSFMSGQKQWAVNGGIAIVIGAVLLLWLRRKA